MNLPDCPDCGKNDKVSNRSTDEKESYWCDDCQKSFDGKEKAVEPIARQSSWQDTGRDSSFER